MPQYFLLVVTPDFSSSKSVSSTAMNGLGMTTKSLKAFILFVINFSICLLEMYSMFFGCLV